MIGINLNLLRAVADLVGAWTLGSTIFFLVEIGLGAICLHYTVKLSKAGLEIKTLAQDLALLRAQVEELSGRPSHQRGRW